MRRKQCYWIRGVAVTDIGFQDAAAATSGYQWWFKPFLPNTRSSLTFLMQNQRPAGNVQTRMWRSKKNETQVVGWCSDTDAMMGMWILA